jgi:hypothetical protein
MKVSGDTAIVLFGYNRPSHLMRVLIALENYNIKKIHFFLDGPKNSKDKIVQKQIIFMMENNRNINITIHKSKKNLGIAKSITTGLNTISKKYKKMIIIEDDCIPRKEFFQFFIKLLNKKNIFKEVGAICGYQFPKIHQKNKRTIYPILLNYFIPWGWATTSSHWINFEKMKKNKSNFYHKKDFSKIIKKLNTLVKNNSKNIWSLNFIIYNFLTKKNFIFPSKSLVKNIGFDGTGVNSKITNSFDTIYTATKKIDTKHVIEDDKLKKDQEMNLLKYIRYFY